MIVSNTNGVDLIATTDSVLEQNFSRFEIILKCNDQDISNLVQKYSGVKNIKLISQPDTGIYDAMNQAIVHCLGEYTFFLNVGDRFYDRQSLSYILANSSLRADVIYSSYIYRNCVNHYPKKITRGFFFRSALCHQAYFLKTEILKKHKFNLDFKVLADHDLLLRCQNTSSLTFEKINRPLAELALMGFSAENIKIKNYERKALEAEHFSYAEFLYFSIFNWLSMRALRNYMIRHTFFYNLYHRVKAWFYS